MTKEKCLAHKCTYNEFLNGLCKKHYLYAVKNNIDTSDIKKVTEAFKNLLKDKNKDTNLYCKEEGCHEWTSIKGYCLKHYHKEYIRNRNTF